MDGPERPELRVERKPPALELTIDRPEVRNALDRATRQAILAALDRYETDPDVRAVVISGAGDKAFSAGADLRMFASMTSAEALEYTRLSKGTLRRIAEYPKPVIAKVRGVAFGGGNELAMACDLVYATPESRFGQPEVNVGLLPGAGGTQRLPRFVGYRTAIDLLWTGAPLNAEEALRKGLLTAVVPSDQLDAAVAAKVDQLAAKSAWVLAQVKDATRRSFELPLSEGLDYESRLFALAFATDDLREGVAAFLETRPARFRGR